MASIEVNHKSLRRAASKIKNYCDYQKQMMSKADSKVQHMVTTTVWTGSDARAFMDKWEEIQSNGSVAFKFSKSLENCAKALEASASLYAKAQEQAYTQACWLPKLLW